MSLGDPVEFVIGHTRLDAARDGPVSGSKATPATASGRRSTSFVNSGVVPWKHKVGREYQCDTDAR